jgi:uncharacterized membrane-anchored protein
MLPVNTFTLLSGSFASMHDHSLRDQIVAEVHARPFHKLSGPLALCHQAILYEGVAEEAVNRRIAKAFSSRGMTAGRCALNRMANFTV